MTGDTEREIGKLLARMSALEKSTAAIQVDMREVRDTLLTAKGGWKTLIAVGSIAGGMGAVLAKVLPWLTALPK